MPRRKKAHYHVWRFYRVTGAMYPIRFANRSPASTWGFRHVEADLRGIRANGEETNVYWRVLRCGLEARLCEVRGTAIDYRRRLVQIGLKRTSSADFLYPGDPTAPLPPIPPNHDLDTLLPSQEPT